MTNSNKSEEKFMKTFYGMSADQRDRFYASIINGKPSKEIRDFILIDNGKNSTTVVHKEGGRFRNYALPFDQFIKNLECDVCHDKELIKNIWE